ncbi:hypothetical protein H0X09_00410 [Candidatus Saccharibacteria bacterium]|nr:hypothetical protein [Candidatus Saccharibacteria bacterium]
MLHALANGITCSDYEYASEIAINQTYLRPIEIAEYMEVKGRYAEDPIQRRQWRDALGQYLKDLQGIELPNNEFEEIEELIHKLEPGEIISKADVVADSNDTAEYQPDAENWEHETFFVNLEKERILKLRQLPVFQAAEEHAKGKDEVDPNLPMSLEHIRTYVGGGMAAEMYQAIDWYVFIEAERHALGRGDTRPNFNKASKTIDLCSSSPEVAQRMRSAMDKYVYREAERAILGDEFSESDVERVQEFTALYASTPDRRDAMLKRLGLI